MLFGRMTDMMHQLIRLELGHGVIAIDGTMGNGNDTLFLSRFVGEKGRVIAYDIQATALENTRALLEKEGCNNVELILKSHEVIQDLDVEVDLVMFNLGYLPNGDHSVITKEETTCRAIEAGLSKLKVGGLLTIISYYGHKGGKAEITGVQALLKSLNQKDFDVLEVNAFNKSNNPPIMYLVRKKNNAECWS